MELNKNHYVKIVVIFILQEKKESKKERMVDALAQGGEEGRDKLRKAACRCK